MKKPKTWTFNAPLERMTGRFAWHFVEFPHDVKELFGKRGEVRVKTLINGVPAPGLTTFAGGRYLFQFASPAVGTVRLNCVGTPN